MTQFQLIVQPYKRVKMKIQLVGGSQTTFPWLRKHVLWDEMEDLTWASLNDKTWEESSQHGENDGKKVIKDIEGDAISLSLSIDSKSDIRRVVSLSMHLNDPEYFESTFVTIWLNRLIQIQFGILDADSGVYAWFPLGTFMVTNSMYTYNATIQQLQLSIADLMASVTEERGNQIGADVTIAADTFMKEALEGAIERFFPFTSYQIGNFLDEKIPYDLEFPRGSYPYEIARQIVTLYPTYEHFYSVDGKYIAQEIPTGVDDNVVLTEDELEQIIISEEGVSAPKDIKNVIEVWGKELDADHTAESCNGVAKAGVYQLYIGEEFEVLEDGMTLSFTADVICQAGQKMQIQSTAELGILVADGNGNYRSISAGDIIADTQYVVKYTNGMFVLQGPSVIHAMCFLFNAPPSDGEIAVLRSKYGCNDIMIAIDRDSIFSVEWIGEQVRVLSGGEFDNIYTTELALERAYYENWKAARVQDTLKLTMLYVPWLDVNQKIRYRSVATNKVNEYMVNSIQVNLETFTMAVDVSRFYPYYPWLRNTLAWSNYSNHTWEELEDVYWDEMTYRGVS